MKRLLLPLLMMHLFFPGYGQPFSLNVPNTYFQLENGAGFDTRIGITFSGPDPAPVHLSATVPQGIVAVLQPDTVYQADTVVLSVMVKDSTLTGPLTIIIRAKDPSHEVVRPILVTVLYNGSNQFPEYPAITYRNAAFAFLNSVHPEIMNGFGDPATYNWAGFWQYPPLIVVSNYVFLSNNWRCDVLWHIMIPPYNWKKVFLYNDLENVCLGVNIDTDGNCSEIACEKHYYFYQDTFALDDGTIPRQVPVLQIYPNPSSSFATLRFSNPWNLKHSLSVYDIKAGLMQEIPDIYGEEVRIDVHQWKPGFFLFKLQGPDGIFSCGKLLKY